MKKVILALAELYIDFDLFETIELTHKEIILHGEFNYKTAKEVLRLNMDLKKHTNFAIHGGEIYAFEKVKDQSPILKIRLIHKFSTNEDLILDKLKKQFEL